MKLESSWEKLRAELDVWHDNGLDATFWWRDDDAGKPLEKFDRLLCIAEEFYVPIAVAAVPKWLTFKTIHRIHKWKHAVVLQHGYTHQNCEPASHKKAEFGSSRDHDKAIIDLRAGQTVLMDMCAAALPILTPPWNRISRTLVAELPAAGFLGLSTYQARVSSEPVAGLVQVNAHVDIVDWHGRRDFIGEKAALNLCISHLQNRRRGAVDAGEPTGLLTHHVQHDKSSWHFIENFLRVTKQHPAATWPYISNIFHQD